MKAVLITVAGLLVISVQAQVSCPSPSYTEDIVPKCLANPRIRLPSYAEQTSYYDCKTGTPILTKCTGTTPFFTYVYQECTTCDQYIPAVECSQNKLGLDCVPISGSNTTPSGGSSAAPTTVTTPKPAVTTLSTAAPGGSTNAPTTTAFPGPPVESTVAGGSTTPGTGATGTTISVPGPPGPVDPDVPSPPSVDPTVGTINPYPPTVSV